MENEIQGEMSGEEKKRKERPVFSVVQPVTDAEGNKKLKSVGGLWKNTSKSGRTFYTLSIGPLRLLAFPNEGSEREEKTRAADADEGVDLSVLA